MESRLMQYINSWATEEDSQFLRLINLRIEHIGHHLYNDYEPSAGPKPNFFQRLEKWIDNVEEDEAKKTLLRFVPEIFYVGQKEMEALYRVAFETIIIRWIIEQKGIKINAKFEENIFKGIEETWFCPITDSMRINQFYHVNSIRNNSDVRPEWRSLTVFGSIEKIKSHLDRNQYKRIALLEDFVGSGNQIKNTIEFAAENFPEYSIVIIPIIMCPQADNNLSDLSRKYPNLTIEPALRLDESSFIPEDKGLIEDKLKIKIHEIAHHEYKRMKKAGLDCSYLGFRKIGATIVLYTNTPNNSLPIIWSDNNWQPLFNRHIRIKK